MTIKRYRLGLALLAALPRLLSAQTTLSHTPGPEGGSCGPTEITHSATQDIVSGSIACVDPMSGFNFENHYTRAFDLTSFGIVGAFSVCEVEVAVEAALSVAEIQPLTVRLYWTESGTFPGGTLTPIGEATVMIPDQDQSYVTIPVTGTAPPGTELVVDVASADGTVELAAFLIGSNDAGQTAPGYLTAPDCGYVTPTDLATIGAPDMHIVINARGTEGLTALAAGPLRVDAHTAPGVVSNLNGVFEAGETVQVEPAWANPGVTSFSLTGLAQGFGGPAGPSYTISTGTADYGMLGPIATSNCWDATTSCFELQITGARPVTHWDALLDETVNPTPIVSGGVPPPSHTWTLHVGESFPDVPASHQFYAFVETIFHNGVTGGCAAAPELLPGRPGSAQADGRLRPQGEGGPALRAAAGHRDLQRRADVRPLRPLDRGALRPRRRRRLQRARRTELLSQRPRAAPADGGLPATDAARLGLRAARLHRRSSATCPARASSRLDRGSLHRDRSPPDAEAATSARPVPTRAGRWLRS